MNEQEQLEAAKFKIKQLNRIIAVAMGRLDVVNGFIEKAEANGKPIDYEFKYFVDKSRKSLDEMMERLLKGEEVTP